LSLFAIQLHSKEIRQNDEKMFFFFFESKQLSIVENASLYQTPVVLLVLLIRGQKIS
jgi:hypothetical protein